MKAEFLCTVIGIKFIKAKEGKEYTQVHYQLDDDKLDEGCSVGSSIFAGKINTIHVGEMHQLTADVFNTSEGMKLRFISIT